MDELDQMRSISHAVTGKIRLLYLSPERALSVSFRSMLERIPVSFIAVDEAHCISRWGNDFRPEYAKLAMIRKITGPHTPFIALTATATDEVIQDIIESLKMKEPGVFKGSFFRENLSFEVRYPATEAEREESLISLFKEEHSSNLKSRGKTIIYCSTRKGVEHVHTLLKENGVRSERYHAGRSGSIREKTQNGYRSGLYPVLVATSAFGMGMDQEDVRMVIHYNVPDSLESYYQEAGRAGRDGKFARCILFYRSGDLNTHRFLQRKNGNAAEKQVLLERMVAYVNAETCRQIKICEYFGETISKCRSCDVCLEQDASGQKTGFPEKHPSEGILEGRKRYLREEKSKEQKRLQELSHEWTENELLILTEFLKQHPGRFGRNLIAAVLTGSQSLEVKRKKLDQLESWGKLTQIKKGACLAKIDQWLESRTALTTGGKYPKVYLKGHPPEKRSRNAKQTEDSKTSHSPSARGSATEFDPEKQIQRELTLFRDRKARQQKVKKYAVLQNAVIKRIATIQPITLHELSMIKGIGDTRLASYGEEILEILSRNLNR